MSYRFHYIFFGGAADAVEELAAFHEVLADFNSERAMPNGHLLCGLTLVAAVQDKRAYQGAIFENLRMSRYLILVLEDSWGPPARDFEKDWAYAQRCISDPDLPMQEAAILFKAPLLPHKVDPPFAEFKQALLSTPGPHAAFESLAEYKAKLRALLDGWFASIELT